MTAESGNSTGKILFVTGAGTGFGRDFAHGFAASGAAVAVSDVDLSAAEATAAGIRATGGKAIGLHCDVASEAGVQARRPVSGSAAWTC